MNTCIDSTAHGMKKHIKLGPRVAPTEEQFKLALEETLRTAAVPIRWLQGVGSRKKIRKMQYALAEGKRRRWRRFWKKAKSMTLAQDERSTNLLARWRACGDDLKVKIGVMGLARELPNPFTATLGSDSTRAATQAMLSQAVRPSPAPYIKQPTNNNDTSQEADIYLKHP